MCFQSFFMLITVQPLLFASSYSAGRERADRSAYYSSNVDVDFAFLNDGLNGTCKVWISYEAFIFHPANRRSSRWRDVDGQYDSVECA
jgi:hypothetical protein